MRKTLVLVLVGVALAFGIPLVRFLMPGGERGPDSLSEVLVVGGGVAVLAAVIVAVKWTVGAGAFKAGRRLRERRDTPPGE